MSRPPGNPAMEPFGTSIFTEMSALAVEHKAINLGQGFPDTDGPIEVLEAAREAIAAGRNQYPPGRGYPELLTAIAQHQHRFYGLHLNPAEQVLVTVGATEAIAMTMLALVQPGDEVVVFEPYYDSYAATIALAGGVRRTSLLRFPDFAVDEESLRAAFSDRTRLVLLNTPHNPTGKVFTRDELELIAELAKEHDAWVVTDEVYEHLVFDGGEHIPIATLPGMLERTLTISSGGKTFSTTGWKIGWVSGPAQAISAIAAVKQFATFGSGGPFQVAIARGLNLPDSTYASLTSSLQAKRDLLLSGLQEAGIEHAAPAGTYFVIADLASRGVTDALDFARAVPAAAGVVVVPVSAFCDDTSSTGSLVRLAFCKEDDIIRQGLDRLHRFLG
ncbi:MAG: aminotransferase class I/II-fold pyridoxal phosphate-dependent enzyme [Actinomycetia bacterium]|nr:aminotransferase class I/II-fold pyridoxal phosphate-dependent enzyme [Actinomycetes bacterium]